MMARPVRLWACALLAASALTSCGDGGGAASGEPPVTIVPPGEPPVPSPPLYTPPEQLALTSDEVRTIVAQAAEEARARSLPAVIAVTDRVGNVLAVFSMSGARATATIRPGKSGNIGLQGAEVPATAAAIAKALTGAYLSSSGNAFSSRTASMIIQQHFPPSPFTAGLESGPLFGVQLSSLPCSDIMARFEAGSIGPKRSPLGLSADPGGLPIYKNGVVVGGIGVMADGDYGFDDDVSNVDTDDEELIALAGVTGFAAPDAIRADRIAIDGTTLRYVDGKPADLKTRPAEARPLSALAGALTAVAGYYDGTAILFGQAYGSEASGIRAATPAEFSPAQAPAQAYVLSDGTGANRFPIRAGSDAADVGTALSQVEARAILEEAFAVMARARGQIRKPLDSRAQMSISLVDTRGVVLGLVRGVDAPLFGIDVSVQKARTAALFSNRLVAADLAGAAEPEVRDVVAKMRDFLLSSHALTGNTAFTARAIGNLARPHFPDGEVTRGPGPLSVSIDRYSPFATGLQTNLIAGDLVTHLGYLASGGAAPDVAPTCTSLPKAGPANRLANGLQIFPGSVPIYRGTTLVGAVGVSGDGIDQDDMAAFLGVHGAAARVGGIANAPSAMRSDQIVVASEGAAVRLRYVGCPFAPFLGAADQSPCGGK
ncbi:MAG TPA: heme-binding protein [Sphingobium sp.]|nr:heme-binding protein [Sphingobium sp.]